MRQNQKSGFSLIELLVVIAIIALVATLALPYYRASQMRSIRTEAYMGLRQLISLQEAHIAEHSVGLDMPYPSSPDPDTPYYYGKQYGVDLCDGGALGFVMSGCKEGKLNYSYYCDVQPVTKQYTCHARGFFGKTRFCQGDGHSRGAPQDFLIVSQLDDGAIKFYGGCFGQRGSADCDYIKNCL